MKIDNSSPNPIKPHSLTAFADEYFLSNFYNHLKKLNDFVIHFIIFCLILLQLQFSTESTNLITKSFSSFKEISSSKENQEVSSFQENNFIFKPKIKLREKEEKDNFSTEFFNASSLFSLRSKSDSRLPLRHFVPEGVLAKNAVRVFLTPEPTATDSHLKSEEIKRNGVFTFSNTNRGNFDTKVINTNITAAISNDLNKQAIEINTANLNYVEYNKNTIENPPPSLKSYLDQLNANQTLYNPIEETHKHWDDTVNGLTGVSQAIIAVVVIATMPAGMGLIGGAMASVATTKGLTSAVNASLNVHGNFLNGLDDIGKTTLKDTTSSDTLKSIAIAGITAGITAGLTSALSSAANTTTTTTSTTATSTTTATNTVNTANTASNIATTTTNTATNLVNSTSSTITFQTQLVNNLQTATINTITSSAVQSAINGDSFADSLKNSAKNILINAAGELAANQIGTLAHNGDINTTTQLTLHAGLGCGMGIASNGSGGCASGAVSGITGELSAGFADKTLGLNDSQIKQFSGLAGSASALLTGIALNQDDKTIANNIFSGQRIAENAAANNYLMPREKKSLVDALATCGTNQNCKDQVQAKYQAISEPRDEKLRSYTYKCVAFGNCEKFDKINKDLKLTTTFEGNNYYNSLTPEQKAEQFVLLPPEKAIYHNYPTKNGKIDLLNQADYKKYIHPVMGYEVVVDNKGNLVTDQLNIGTYNFYNPSGYGYNNPLITSTVKHGFYDVGPYYFVGNSDQDPSSFYDRTSRYILLKPSINEKALSIRNSIQNLGN